MLGRSAGILTACAQVASAFLIPGNLENDVQAVSLSILEAPTRHQLITLPCSDCVFSAEHEQVAEIEESDEPLFFIQGGANSVAVNFTVSHDGHRLEVNGEAIYPLGLQIENIFKSPKTYVHQVPSSASVKDIENGEAKTTPVEVTGHGVSIIEEAVVSDTGDMLVPIKFSIFELQGQPVSLDEVSVQLLKQASGELAIMHVETVVRPPPQLAEMFDLPPEWSTEGRPYVPSEETFDMLPPHHTGHHEHHSSYSHKDCEMLPATICKLKHVLESKVKGMRKGGCHGRKGKHHKLPGHIKPHFMRPGHDDDQPHGHHHGRPHHMRPHSQEHHHHHRHGHGSHFLHAFSRGLAAVMIPTMAGVAVGMIVSLIGLLAGRLIGFLWIKFYRGGKRGYASVALDEASAEQQESEKHFEDKTLEECKHVEIEVLPVYEEAPTYEEAVREQK